MKITSKQRLNSQVMREVNRVRTQHDLKSLKWSTSLARAAARHSRSMATGGYFAHKSFNGLAFWRRIKAFYSANRRKYWSVGENLAWASPDLNAKQVVKMWMESPPHRANLLSKKWHEIGISVMHSSSAPGTYQNQATTIITADFGARY